MWSCAPSFFKVHASNAVPLQEKKKKDNKGEDQEWTDFDVRKELE